MKIEILIDILQKTKSREEFKDALRKHRDTREIFVIIPMTEQKKYYQ